MVYFEDPFWVGVFERIENGELSAAKVTFGAEPKDYEVQEFINKHYYHLQFREYVNLSVASPQISESEFLNLTNDFYFHNIWAAKKLLRGELWSAKMCVDAYLKNYLLKMIELYCYQEGRNYS